MISDEEIIQKIASLSETWRKVELVIKRAEFVQQAAAIPSINELRYAGRQIFLIPVLLAKKPITPINRKHIERRLTIAEQYVLNAEHDVVDAMVSYFNRETLATAERIGSAQITPYFPDFPLFRKLLEKCRDLIAETRENGELRKPHYATMHLMMPTLYDHYEHFIEAEINAKYDIAQKEAKHTQRIAEMNADVVKSQAALVKANKFNRLTGWASIFGAAISVVSIIVAFAMWRYGYVEFCRINYPNIWSKMLFCTLP